jgi:hypothetical protein
MSPSPIATRLLSSRARLGGLLVLAACLGMFPAASGVSAAALKPALTDAERQDLTNRISQATREVTRIVNQPVTRVQRLPGMHVAMFTEGWFHPGASRPNFNTVDVRQTQEFPYDKFGYVSSPLNPGVAFIGRELEFNSMTKIFYVDRTVPKKKLTEAQMVEINRLYRVIGDCERQLSDDALIQGINAGGIQEAEADTNTAPQTFAERLQRIPRKNLLMSGGAIALILVLYVIYKMQAR